MKYSINFVNGDMFTDIVWSGKVTPLELANKAYKNPHVSTVVNRIANSASSLRMTEDSTADFFDKETAYKCYVSLLLYGEVFMLKIVPTGRDKVKKLEVLENTLVTVMYDESSAFKDIVSINYQGNSYTPDQVLHIKYADVTSEYPRGLSPLNGAEGVYRSSSSIFKFEEFLYENRGAVGILSSGSPDIPITPKEQERLQDEFQKRTAGVSNAGKILLSSAPVNYTPITFKPTDMMAKESQLEKLRNICAIYNVSSALFNDSANQTYNNMKEAKKAFYVDAVFPLVNLVCEHITKSLNEVLVFDFDVEALREEKEKLEKAREIHLRNIEKELQLADVMLEKGIIKESEYKERLIELWKN